jgi:hypothetical protein
MSETGSMEQQAQYVYPGKPQRTEQTIAIEERLRSGQQSISAIARQVGLTRQRVSAIRRRMMRPERVKPWTQQHYEAAMPEEALKGMKLLEATITKEQL